MRNAVGVRAARRGANGGARERNGAAEGGEESRNENVAKWRVSNNGGKISAA